MNYATLQTGIRRIYNRLRNKMKDRWNRCLPFTETLVDRWEKARFLGFGQGTSIYDSAYVFGDVTVGENTWIGPNVILDGSGKLEIGSYCSISAGVHVYTHNTVKWAVSGGKEPYERQPVSVGNCCFIGPQSVIRNGVAIGDHCVIGACSFVTKDIPSYSIAVGQPARIVGSVRIDDAGKVNFEYFPTPAESGEEQ